MRSGIAISLKYQHDHIEDAILVYTSQYCVVYLIAEGEAIERSFVKLEFDRARCARSARTDCSPAIGIYPNEPGRSFLVELTDSKWAVEAHEAYTYVGSSLKPHRRHFVVSNHDVFHEILADSFSETLVAPGDTDYEVARFHFA